METLEAMRIMSIPEDEQIGKNNVRMCECMQIFAFVHVCVILRSFHRYVKSSGLSAPTWQLELQERASYGPSLYARQHWYVTDLQDNDSTALFPAFSLLETV